MSKHTRIKNKNKNLQKSKLEKRNYQELKMNKKFIEI